MRFEIRLFNLQTGSLSIEEYEAISEQQAVKEAQQTGFCVLSVRARSKIFQWLPQRVYEVNYVLFCRELQTLMVAGMGVVEALNTLCEFDTRGNKIHIKNRLSLAKQLYTYLQQGQSLSLALSSLPDVPQVLLACVRSVEHTSNLLDALNDYLRHQELISQLRSKIVSAAIYPAIVISLGMGITLFLLIVVMPQFSQMYIQLKGEAKGLTSLVINFSQWITINRLPVILHTLIAFTLIIWWFASGKGMITLNKWIWNIAWLRRSIMDYQLALFYQSLYLLCKGGYTLVNALDIAKNAAVSNPIETSVKACQTEIMQGRSVSNSLYNAGLANEIDRRLLAAAEDDGEFFKVSYAIAQLHRKKFELMIERLTSIAEPLLLLLTALMVGTIVVIMYMPIFELGVTR